MELSLKNVQSAAVQGLHIQDELDRVQSGFLKDNVYKITEILASV